MTTPQPRFMSVEQVEAIFTFHPVHGDQAARYGMIRREALQFARRLLDLVPDSPERALAIRDLQRCVMMANAAIAIHEASELEVRVGQVEVRGEVTVDGQVLAIDKRALNTAENVALAQRDVENSLRDKLGDYDEGRGLTIPFDGALDIAWTVTPV